MKKPPSMRQKRLSEQIYRLLLTEMRQANEPFLKPIHITQVQLSRDLASVKVMWYFHSAKILKNQEPQGQSIQELKDHIHKQLFSFARYFRSVMAQNITMRKTPEIEFCYDIGLEQAERLNEILDKV